MVNEPDERPPEGARAEEEGSHGAGSDPSPSTDQLRIGALQAAVAAGLAPSTGRREEERAETVVPALPDWTDPPTGQVPRVLLEHDGLPGAEETVPLRGPTWREEAADWDDDLGLGFLGPEEESEEAGLIAGRGPDTGESRPFEFGFEELDLRPRPGPPHPGNGQPHGPGHEGLGHPSGRRNGAGRAGHPSMGPSPTGPSRIVPLAVAGERQAGAGGSGEEPMALPGPPGEGSWASAGEDAAWEALLREGEVDPAASRPRREARLAGTRGPRRRGGSHRKSARPPSPGRSPASPPPGEASAAAGTRAAGRSRNPVVATLTGMAFGLAALACFLLGPVATLVLVTVVLTVAAGEAFGTLRRAGRRPATLLGLVAVPVLIVGTYLWGAVAVPAVLAALVVAGTLWYLGDGARVPGELRPGSMAGLASTLLVTGWVGVLGAFGGLLLAPSIFPHRHGVAFVVGVVAVTVAHDVGCYATGARLGRHRLAPRVSPNKTWEGIAGGTALAFVVAGAIVSRISPIGLWAALVLAAVVSVLGPLGDLAESLLKRELGVKDMGRLLPEHGGLFDRVDAMLFVLPAAYLLFRLAHLG